MRNLRQQSPPDLARWAAAGVRACRLAGAADDGTEDATMVATTENALDRWLISLADQDASPHTLRAYRLDLEQFRRRFEMTAGESWDAAAVTPTDVREYRAWLIGQGAAPATVNRRLAALRRFFAWARAERLIDDNPAERVRDVERQRLAPRGLDRRELNRLLRAVERHGDRRDLAIVELLRHTGLRVSELTGLRVADVLLGERSGQVTVRAGKGSKTRVVPLNADARRALRDYLERRGPTDRDGCSPLTRAPLRGRGTLSDTDKGRPGAPPRVGEGMGERSAPAAGPASPLWINQRGEPLTAAGVYDVVTRYARIAGVDCTPHTLRHTFARAALDAGAPLVDVAALLGHRRLDTTAVYTQPSARDLVRAVERLEEG